MDKAFQEYERWLAAECVSAEEKEELKSLSKEEIVDRFGTDIAFGTAGLRGVMAPGNNRMNRFTVRRAAAGMAGWIAGTGKKDPMVVIAYDSRNHSAEYAMETALVLAAHGVQARLFESLRPTPELSYAVRRLHADAGVVITASHNPSAYNGFKAYGPDGGQMANEAADACLAKMNEVDLLNVPSMEKEEALSKGLLVMIGEDIDQHYIAHVLSQRTQPDITRTAKQPLKLVYTALHGAGAVPVLRVMKAAGHTEVYPVQEQLVADGNFPTVVSPNPETPSALAMGRELADKVGADTVLGTDPDSDRAAVCVRVQGGWKQLTGNQMGCLLLEYLLRTGHYSAGAYAVTSIVSTRMVEEIARAYNAEMNLVLTGFKYIAEVIENKTREGIDAFVMGFEESCGYLTGGYIRDKDAVIASLLIADMALYYQEKGMTLADALEEMYSRYGYFLEKTVNMQAEGVGAMERIAKAV
ncbi:MAG: phospho-sugar mutase, partial [Clostridia bacterium]|nr:phospho-sugar mutase [Clostridia bacterium]